MSNALVVEESLVQEVRSLVQVSRGDLGIFSGIPISHYHTLKGISFSGLVRFAQSPAHYKEYLLNPPEPTQAMNLGTAVHSAVLEKGLETKAIVQAPDVDRRTKDGKSQWNEFQSSNVGKIILSPDDYSLVQNITQAVEKHPVVAPLLKKGQAEQSAFWVDPVTGVLCKCRPDFLRTDGIVIDIKTTQNACPREFQKTIGAMRYHWQSAFYLDGLSHILGEPLNQFVHVAIEKEAPYGIGVYVLDDVSLERARQDIRILLDIYAGCVDKDIWPAYAETIQNITLPSWAW